MNRQGLIIGVAVVVAVLVGVGLWTVFGGDDTGDTVTPIRGPERAEDARNIIADIQRRTETQPRAAEPPPAAAPAPGPAQPNAAEGGAPAEPEQPALPTNELDRAFAEAEAFRAEGKLPDAQLLYFFAARQGHGRAAFQLAAIYDPLHFIPEQSLLEKPDPFQAFRWYNTAREAGIAEAADRLDALRNWATDAAAKGNAEAEQLLLQWR